MLSGVTRSFPTLNFAFLEGGVAWASELYAGLVGHCGKRNRKAMDAYDPRNIDVEMLADLFATYGQGLVGARPDPADPNIIWSGCYEGVISRLNLRDGQVRDVSVWPDVADGWTPSDLKYRWNWSIPLALSPFDPNRIYVGSQYVHETTDGGQTWKDVTPQGLVPWSKISIMDAGHFDTLTADAAVNNLRLADPRPHG